MMQFLQINGAQYAYTVYQEDSSLPYLLMLHGFMGDGRVFHHLIEGLSKSCNPITVDLLGHGKSEKADSPSRYSAEHQIDDLKTLVERLNVTPLFLYGYSMGGRLGLRTALSYPELFEGIILESTNDGIKDKLQRQQRLRLDEERADQILNDFYDFLKNWQTLKLFKSSIPTDKILEKNYHDTQQSQDPKALAASLQGFSNGNMEYVRPKLANFNNPVLLLVGKEDEKYVKINDTMAQHFEHAVYRKIKAGHRVHLDNPKELVKHITQFIEQNS